VKPVRVEAHNGQVVILSCAAARNPEWYYMSSQRTPYNRKSLTSTNFLVKHSIQKKDTGFYYCYGMDGLSAPFLGEVQVIVNGNTMDKGR